MTGLLNVHVDGTSSRRPAGLQIAQVVLGALIFLLTALGFFLPDGAKWLTGIPVAALVFAGLIVTWKKSEAEQALRRDSERLAKAERDRSAVLFGHNVREVLDTIDGLVEKSPGKRSDEVAAVRLSAAVQTKEGVSPTDARAAYFRVADITAPSRTMSPDKVASSPERQDRFTTVFDEANPADSDVWEIVDGHRPPAFVEDTARWVVERAKGDTVPTYGTFITVRVQAGGIPFGALTVNAIRPGSLLKEDRLFVEAIASLLGIAELFCLTYPAYQKAVTATASRAAVSAQASTVGTSEGGAG
ncbi:hypothetical protein [Georgenia sp. Marseille-Q6866]